jgi:hypothetical protein
MNVLPEMMWKIYEDIRELVKFSDAKAAAILAANGAILAIIFSKSVDNVDFLIENKILLASIALGFVFGFGSIYCAMRAIEPRLDLGEPSSLLYFAHIASNFNNHYIYKLYAERAFGNESETSNQIAYQIWANSIVALKKYKKIQMALHFFLGQFIFFGLAGIEIMRIMSDL